MSNDMTAFSAAAPTLDIGIAVLWLLISSLTWTGYEERTQLEDTEERALGASVIMGQLSATITGSSVILAGVGAFVALEKGPILYPANYHLGYGATWAVISLGLALFTMATLPTRAPTRNFVRVRGIAIACSMGLLFSLAAGARFVLAVWAILPF